jgi:hypothetical protein
VGAYYSSFYVNYECIVAVLNNIVYLRYSETLNGLEARRIANDCYRYIMDLCTNAGIVNEALKFVTQKQEQINTLQKVDERIDDEVTEQQEEETTTNSVF